MSLDTATLQSWLLDHATAVLGAAAAGSEPKTAPGEGLVGAGWVANLRAVPERSTLAATCARVDWQFRFYRNAFAADGAATERLLLNAADALIAACHADITITDIGANVVGLFDPLGETGAPIECPAGFVEINKLLYRSFTLNVGVNCDGAWPQGG